MATIIIKSGSIYLPNRMYNKRQCLRDKYQRVWRQPVEGQRDETYWEITTGDPDRQVGSHVDLSRGNPVGSWLGGIYCRTRLSNSHKNSDEKLSLSLEFAIEITPSIPYIGVVFPFMGLLSFLFLDGFEGNTNISVPIKSGSTVIESFQYPHIHVCRCTWMCRFMYVRVHECVGTCMYM